MIKSFTDYLSLSDFDHSAKAAVKSFVSCIFSCIYARKLAFFISFTVRFEPYKVRVKSCLLCPLMPYVY